MNKDLLKKRYKKEKRFILIGRIAVSLTIIFLVILLGSILLRGISLSLIHISEPTRPY